MLDPQIIIEDLRCNRQTNSLPFEIIVDWHPCVPYAGEHERSGAEMAFCTRCNRICNH